jgi:hypothetical protein
MNKVLWTIYGFFAVGAAKKALKTLKNYRNIRLQYTLATQMFGLDAYRVVLVFVKTKDMGATIDGEAVRLRVSVPTGIVKTFCCRGANGYMDAITRIRGAMDKYLAKYYPDVDLQYEIYQFIPYRHTQSAQKHVVDDATWEQFHPIYQAFMSIPRHL